VVMQDSYKLMRTVLQVAKPQGEVDRGAMLEMCEGMCGEYVGAGVGDFDLGDRLGSVLGGLSDANYKVDPFLTNLARGIVAMEGTIKTLSPKINILNFFTDKVDTALDFNLDLEHPENMNPEIAVKLLQLFNAVTDSSTKTAESLDMLEKGQIKVRTDFSFEEKALKTVSRLVGYVIRALIIIAVFIGSCLLCTAPAIQIGDVTISFLFPLLGVIGLLVCIFFTWRLYRDWKKGKE